MSNPDTASIGRHLLLVEGGELPLTVARSNGAGAAVVIMPSAFGVAADLEAQMSELAADACLVVAMDPFFRSDPGAAAYDDMPRIMARLQSLDRERTYRDVLAAIDWAREEAAGRAVVMLGVCFGGPFALLAAADGAVDGVVTWHGTRMDQYLERAAEMRCPMRLHFGAVDPVVPMAAVDAVRAAFAGRADVRVVVHAGATHGFSHPSSARSYDAPAERAGMASLRELVASAARPTPTPRAQ